MLELADGVDLLIHDAQYTPPEFARKSHWGHCTHDYALFVAKEAGAERLALFHHDPPATTPPLDDVSLPAARLGAVDRKLGVEVLAAGEGLTSASGGLTRAAVGA